MTLFNSLIVRLNVAASFGVMKRLGSIPVCSYDLRLLPAPLLPWREGQVGIVGAEDRPVGAVGRIEPLGLRRRGHFDDHQTRGESKCRPLLVPANRSWGGASQRLHAACGRPSSPCVRVKPLRSTAWPY